MIVLVVGPLRDWDRFVFEAVRSASATGRPARVANSQGFVEVDEGHNNGGTTYVHTRSNDPHLNGLRGGFSWHDVEFIGPPRIVGDDEVDAIRSGADREHASVIRVRDRINARNVEAAVSTAARVARVAGQGAAVDFVRDLGRVMREAGIPVDALDAYGSES